METRQQAFNRHPYYETLKQCSDTAEFKQGVHSLVRRLGFSDYLFRCVNGSARHQPMTSFAPGFLAHYSEQRLADYDMVLQHAALVAVPVYQSMIDQYAINAPFYAENFNHNQALHKLYCGLGYADLFHIPVIARDGRTRAVFSVASKRQDSAKELRACVENARRELTVLANSVTQLKLSTFSDTAIPDLFEPAKVGKKPLLLLRMLAQEDMSLQQAADRLCVSLDTVNKHIRLIKTAFGVNTKETAIYRAIKMGMIEI